MAKTPKFDKILKKGLIADKMEAMDVLRVQIENLVKTVNYAIFITDGVETIDLDTANVHMKELNEKVTEYLKLKKEIEELE